MHREEDLMYGSQETQDGNLPWESVYLRVCEEFHVN